MKYVSLTDGRTVSFRQGGSGRPLVLLHGWSMSSAVFTELIEALGTDFLVLAPDLRGHGESADARGYRLEDFAGDLSEWLTILGLESVCLIGWSLGGQVALRLWQIDPVRVARLGLISTTPRFVAAPGWKAGLPDGQVLSMLRNLRRNYQRTMSDFFALQFDGENLDRERFRQIVDFAVRQGRLPEPAVASESLQTLRHGDLTDLLPLVSCPTLVVHGELDRICPPEAGRLLASALTSATFQLMPSVGHAPFLSRPQSFAEICREFFS